MLFIVWDDTGFGALSPFGGPIEMPTMQRLADSGLKYTQFHTTAICSPTRASMLTGRNHTTVGMACIAEATTGFPGSNGHIPFETATIAEVLGERGYNTYMCGKWHCVPEDETNMASSKRNWPTGRGFERYYGFLGGETNDWYPDLVQDQQFVDQPYDPPKDGEEWAEGLGDKYHLSKDLADRAIAMIADAKQVAPERPFFMYFCPGANHAPHQPPKEWADKYKGVFDEGYEKIREQILANQKKMGIVPENTELSPINPLAGAEERRRQGAVAVRSRASVGLAVRGREDAHDPDGRGVRRATRSYTDHEIGRLIDYLEQTGELDNTLIVWISDNGASGEGGPNGSVNENKFFNGVMDDMEDNLKYARRARLAGDVQPLLHRLGVRVQHAVQDVQAPHLGRRRRRPDDRALAQGHQGQGRDPRPVHALQRRRADRLRVPRASSRPRWSRATPSGRSKARASGTASTTPRRRRRSRASST